MPARRQESRPWGGSGFGQGTVCQPSQQGLILGMLQHACGERLRQGGQVCPVSDAPSWHRACGCSVGCRFGMSFGPGWASGPGAAIHTDAALHPSRTAGPAGPSSAGGELGTGGAFCGCCQLPLFALFSSSPLVAEQRALWLCTTGNVIKPHAPGASSRGAGGGPGHLLEAGGICCRHCGASAPAGGVWVAVGISLGLQVRSPHPPVCEDWRQRLACRCADTRCHGCSANGASPAAAVTSLLWYLCIGSEGPSSTDCIASASRSLGASLRRKSLAASLSKRHRLMGASA